MLKTPKIRESTSAERTLPGVLAELGEAPFAVEFGVETFGELFGHLDFERYQYKMLGMEIGWAVYHPEGRAFFFREDGGRLGDVAVRTEAKR